MWFNVVAVNEKGETIRKEGTKDYIAKWWFNANYPTIRYVREDKNPNTVDALAFTKVLLTIIKKWSVDPSLINRGQSISYRGNVIENDL